MKSRLCLVVALLGLSLPLMALPVVVLSSPGQGFIHGVDTAESVVKYLERDEKPTLPNLESLSPISGVLRIIYSFGSADQGRAHTFPHYMHFGVDIAAEIGTQVVAVMEGLVQQAASETDLGNFVAVAHSDGYVTVYGHLSRVAVKTGQSISTGSIIGYVGATGLVKEAALHFAIVKNGLVYFDPQSLLRK
jgi:murein DD-endopeptidase MepM/ murein hydrolase activator NlpD